MISLAVFTVLVGSSSAFWDFGHSYVPKIAQDELLKTPEGRIALGRANDFLSVYKKKRPDMTPSEDNYPFVECGRFADEIREDPKKNGNWQFYWHFVDTGFFDQGW